MTTLIRDTDEANAKAANEALLREMEASLTLDEIATQMKPKAKERHGLTLYAIDREIAAILAENDDGELSNDALSRLNQLEIDRTRKLAGIVAVIRNKQSESESIDAEIKRLQAMKASPDNTVERLKTWMLDSMRLHGERKVDLGTLGKPSIRKNSQPTVRLADGADIHNVAPRFRRIIIELDKKAISDAFKAGELLPGEVECDFGEHLRLN